MSRLGAGIETAARAQDISALTALAEQLAEYMQNVDVVFAD